jgi:N-methylhydantoinase A/oxoprolinase/acetone carboxylase beta subunit
MIALHHGVDQRLVRKLDAAIQGVTEELATELAKEVITASTEQVTAKIVKAIDMRAVGHDHLCLGLPGPANSVEAFERETERVDAPVATTAIRIAAVSLNQSDAWRNRESSPFLRLV